MSEKIPIVMEQWCLQKHQESMRKMEEASAKDDAIINSRIDGVVENVATKFFALKELHQAHIDSVRLALEKSEKELEKKFEHVNKLREEVLEDRATMVKVETYNSKVSELDSFMKETRSDLQTLMTQYDKRTTLATKVSVGALLVSIIIPIIGFVLLYTRLP